MISLGFEYADATDAKQFKQTSLFFCVFLYFIALLLKFLRKRTDFT